MATRESNRLDTLEGESYGCDMWADLIHLEGAESQASYTEDFYADTPAVTRNVFGEGVAYYLGTRAEERYTKSLLQRVRQEAGVRPTAKVPPGVDAVRRRTEDASFLFLLNHNQEAVEVRLPNPALPGELLVGHCYGSLPGRGCSKRRRPRRLYLGHVQPHPG